MGNIPEERKVRTPQDRAPPNGRSLQLNAGMASATESKPSGYFISG